MKTRLFADQHSLQRKHPSRNEDWWKTVPKRKGTSVAPVLSSRKNKILLDDVVLFRLLRPENTCCRHQRAEAFRHTFVCVVYCSSCSAQKRQLRGLQIQLATIQKIKGWGFFDALLSLFFLLSQGIAPCPTFDTFPTRRHNLKMCIPDTHTSAKESEFDHIQNTSQGRLCAISTKAVPNADYRTKK